MYTPVSLQELDNARQDVESLEKVINGNENEDVTTRLGDTYPTLSKFINNSETLVQSSIDAVIDGSMITDELVSVGGGETQADKNAEFELDKFDTGITATPQYVGAVGRTLADINSDTVNVKTFGARPIAGFDNTLAFQKAANTGKTIVISGKGAEYEVKGSVVWSTGFDMLVDFRDGAKVIANGGTYSSGYVFSAAGSMAKIGGLSQAAVRYKHGIKFTTAPNLKFNDVLMLYNTIDESFSAWRTYYRAGEFLRVKDSTGVDVTLQKPLYDNYPSTVDVYKVSPIKVHLNNPNIEGDSSAYGLIKAEYARDICVNNPNLVHKKVVCLHIIRSLGGAIIGGSTSNRGDGTGTGIDYGVFIANSQDIAVHGGNHFARRHGVATGGDGFAGGIPCRNIKYMGSTISNDVDAHTHAADMHGNVELSGYYNCTISGGLSLRGKNNTVQGNTLYGCTDQGMAMHATEVIGGVFDIQGNTIYADSDPALSARGLIDFGGNGAAISDKTTEDLTIKMGGNTVASESFGELTSILMVKQRGGVKKINVRLTDTTLKVNNIKGMLYMQLVDGTAATDYIIIDNNISNLDKPIYSMIPAAGFASLGKIRLQSNRLTTVVTPSTSSNIVFSEALPFKWQYPITPQITMSVQLNTRLGTNAVFARNSSINATEAKLAAVSENGVNFSNSNPLTLNAIVGINNV